MSDPRRSGLGIMNVGRVFRQVDGSWEPIGEPLPAWDHLAPRPNEPISPWVLPSGAGYTTGDVIAFAETAHRLVAPIPRTDPAWHDVAQASLLLHDEAEVAAWLRNVELWLCLRLRDGWRGRG